MHCSRHFEKNLTSLVSRVVFESFACCDFFSNSLGISIITEERSVCFGDLERIDFASNVGQRHRLRAEVLGLE